MNKSNIINLNEFHSGFKSLDQFEFHHTLSEAMGISLVLFFKHSCSSCAYWRKVLLEYQQNNRHIRLYEVDLEIDPGLAQEFYIFHLPAMQIYKDGDYYGEIQCEASQGNINDCLSKALSRPPQDHP
ncbi:MAG: thioredoxin family protein [Gammaproteobacteria bacterium]|nr:thioredoxin family protein [Gammaproteobacteria bacterium]